MLKLDSISIWSSTVCSDKLSITAVNQNDMLHFYSIYLNICLKWSRPSFGKFQLHSSGCVRYFWQIKNQRKEIYSQPMPTFSGLSKLSLCFLICKFVNKFVNQLSLTCYKGLPIVFMFYELLTCFVFRIAICFAHLCHCMRPIENRPCHSVMFCQSICSYAFIFLIFYELTILYELHYRTKDLSATCFSNSK